MSGLIVFLTARLDEDEAAAKAVTFRSRFVQAGHGVTSPWGIGNPPMPIADVIDDETAAHIALHDPARVLRDVASGRKLVALHRGCGSGTGLCDDGGHADDDGCGTLAIYAERWSDHPDYAAVAC